MLTDGKDEWAKAHFFIGIGMNRAGIVSKIEEIAERVAQPEGIEIVEVDLMEILHADGIGTCRRSAGDRKNYTRQP